MRHLNLLPWRLARRAARQKEFYSMLGVSALIGAVLAFMMVSWHGAQIDGQTQRNEYLTTQIATLDKQIQQIAELDEQRARLLARKQVIEQLQSSRAQMVHLFDSLVRTIPDGVVLTSIRQEGQVLQLEGRAQSSARVSTYMRMLQSSGWMKNPELVIIEARPGGAPGLPFVFHLRATQSDPARAIDTDGDGEPDAPDPNAALPVADPVIDPAIAPPADPADPAQDPASAEPAAPSPTTDLAPATQPTPEPVVLDAGEQV